MPMLVDATGKQTYRGLVLDDFQRQAMEFINENKSVLVSAPTGVGKTLVADYTIEKCYRDGRQVVYTAPIKALSNQKYKDFKNLFGADAVGIITGDVVFNSNAPILVMTTEIFRNMIMTKDPLIETVSYLILDEIHYISDVDRGSVWEETIIFLPPHVQILGLSATIPNVSELAHWISEIRGKEVEIIKHHERAVPLKHFVFERNLGLASLKQAIKYKKRIQEEMAEQIPEGKQPRIQGSTHMDLVKYIKDQYLPCLYFVFSRKKCEDFAFELARKENLLTPKERRLVEELLRSKALQEQVAANRNAVNRVGKVLVNGIGYHHAGMLPIVKDIVEELLSLRLIKVLYCTETFAVGINMPVKSVCFDSNEKYDGKEFRLMSNQEYFQMAGRAGRRGIDTEGFVFSLADINYLEPSKMVVPDEKRLEDLRSQFNLSYNSVLNLIQHHATDEEIENVLRNNFAYYQVTRQTREMEEQLKLVEAELKKVLAERCDDLYLAGCPIQYQRLWSKMKEDKRDLSRLMRTRWGRSRKYAPKRAALERSIREAQLQLDNLVMRDCAPSEIEKCEGQRKLYNRLDTEKKTLYKELGILRKRTDFVKDFYLKRDMLRHLNFVDDSGQLTPRGKFASKIYVQELLVTELYFDGVFHEWEEEQIIAMIAGIGFEGRKNDWFRKAPVYDIERVYQVIHPLMLAEERMLKKDSTMYHPEVALVAYQWAAGEEFHTLREYCNLADGDIVSMFRRTIDLLRQIRSAAGEDKMLVDKVNECIRKIDRDVVEVNL